MGEGREVPENLWVSDPAFTSTMSNGTPLSSSVLNVANMSVIGSSVVDSSLHS